MTLGFRSGFARSGPAFRQAGFSSGDENVARSPLVNLLTRPHPQPLNYKMNKSLNIKCLFPGNNYLLRKVVIKTCNGKVYRIGHGETIQISHEGGSLYFRLDYHRFKLDVDEVQEQSYILVYLKCRDVFPFYYTDLMFKNAMIAEIVDESCFKNFENNYPITEKVVLSEFSKTKKTIVFFTALLFTGFLVYSIGWVPITSSDRNFYFLLGLVGLILSLRLYFFRRRIIQKHFFYSIIAVSLLPLSMVLFSNINMIIKVILASVSILIFILATIDNTMFTKK